MSRRDIETIFPLAPAQRGIYYQAGLTESPGMHVEQSMVRVSGDLDCEALARAWEHVVLQRPILRTAFVGRDIEKPLQVVFRRASSPMRIAELSDKPAPEVETELDELAKGDREAGFDLTAPPLMRMTVVRLGVHEHCLIWTHHHILMDGWCISLLMDDLWSSYEAFRNNQPPRLAARRPFRDYVTWVEQRNREAAESYWKQQLRGLTAATPLGRPPSPGQTPSPVGDHPYLQYEIRLDPTASERIVALARKQEVTLATIVYAAWAKILAAYSGSDDVVFGVTAAGRPSELPGVEGMLGLFSTTQPLRVRVPAAQSGADWLRQLQNQHQGQADSGGHCGAGDIHKWSGLPGRVPLFDSIVVVENYPISAEALDRSGLRFAIDERPSVGARTVHAVALLITPGRELDLQIVVDAARFEPDGARRILAHLAQMLPQVAGANRQSVTSVADIRADEVPVYFPARWQSAPGTGALPQNETEAAVAKIWADVLGVTSVGVCDDFFALGGHSLIAAQIVSRLAQHFAQPVSLRMLFENRTVRQLSGALSQTQGSANNLPALQPASLNGDHAPASFNQERVWFIDQLGGGNRTAYCEQGAVRLTGNLAEEALERALRALCVRHESLRTSFAEGKDHPLQRVGDAPDRVMDVVDLRAAGNDGRQQLFAAIAQDRQTDFELARGPLWRATLFRLADDEHVLLLSIHHIITDGWSHALLFRELGELYAAARDARPARLATPALRFTDFTVWQRQLFSGTRLEEELAFWRQYLHGAPSTTTIPADFPRPPVQRHRGAKIQRSLGAPLSNALKAYASGQGASAFMVYVAAFAHLLYRYSGQTDLVIGTPIAGRPEPSLEAVVGFFVNTLVLRTDVAGNPSLSELLGRVREAALDAYAHQDAPFDKIVEEIAPERSLNRNPVFQVFVNMLNHPSVQLDLDGLRIEELEIPESSSMFDLTLYIRPQDDSVQLALLYDRDLFEPLRMQTALEHLEELLRQGIAAPDRPLESYSLTAPEQQTPAWHLPPVSVRHADSTDLAVACGATRISAADMNHQASRLASDIAHCGGSAGDVVAIYATRNAALPVAVDGVLRSGCAFVVLDSSYPPAVLLTYLQRSKARFWLALTGDIPPALAQAAESLVSLHLSPAPLDGGARCGLPAWLESPNDDAAYIAFTSGTTGMAKALRGRREPLRHFVQWYVATFDVGKNDRFALLSGLGHDPALRDMLIAPALGAPLFVPPPRVFAEPKALTDFLANHRISVIHITPALGRALASVPGTSLPALRYVFFAGESLDYRDVHALSRLAPNATCVNLYGATETPQAVTWHIASGPSAPGPLPESGPVPIGRPVPGWQVSILNQDGRHCGSYEPGELIVSGTGLTAPLQSDIDGAGFIASADGAATPGGYRTGDFAFRRRDGVIQYIGRRDRQVKIRGHRIEIGAIEEVIKRAPNVSEAAVCTFGSGDDSELIGYYAGEHAEKNVLEDYIATHLPLHMRPNRLVSLAALPLTSNGKVAFDRLPRPDYAPTPPTHIQRADELQSLVLGTLGEVLQAKSPIGLDDDFFTRGGHSLRAARAIGRLSEVLGVDVPLAALFENRTVRRLAAAIATGDFAPCTLVTTRPAVAGPAVASDAQRRLWLLDKLAGNAGAYNMTSAILLSGDLEPESLRSAFVEIVRRHESLRTRFIRVGAQLHQEVLDAASFTLHEVDLSGERDPMSAARQLCAAHARTRFRLEDEAPVRVTLARLGDSSHVLLLCIHHIVCDRWSMGVLQRDFSAAYRRAVEQAGDLEKPLPIQYRDFALWQHGQSQSPAMVEHREYWRKALTGNAPLSMPTDFPRPALRNGAGSTHSADLGPRSKLIDELARSIGVTPFALFLAVVKVLLFRYTNQQDLTVGTPTAGRTQRILEDQVGCYVNLLVLRSHVEPEQRFSDLVRQLAGTAASAYAHQAYSFDRLVETVGHNRDLSRSPLFDVAVVMQQPEGAPLSLKDVSATLLGEEPHTSKYDLSFVLEDRNGDYRLHLEYDTALFLPGRIERMAQHVCALLDSVSTDIDVPVGHVRYLPAAEWNNVVEQWNRTEAAFPGQQTIVGLIAAQAGIRRDAVAVQCGDGTLSYAELEDQSNRLARALAARGVAAGALVPIMQRPDHRAIISFLAVQKLGAAYVPIDSEFPAARVRHILSQCAPAHLLADDEHRSILADCLPAGLSAEVLDTAARDARGDPLTIDARPDSAAYVIFTSGSTGVPKGCVVTQRNLVRLFANERFPLDVGADDVWLCAHSLAFDFSVWEIYGALVTGGRVVIAPRRTARDVSELRKLLISRRVTVLSQTPAAFLALAEIEANATEHRLDDHLRYVVFGGDRLAPNRLAAWSRHYSLDRIVLCNMYGITETTVHVTNRIITQADVDDPHSTSPIGVPLPETKTFICDSYLQPVPIGVPGEILVGGSGVCRGYLGNPVLTDARFVTAAFAPSERLYRSGDLGRWREDGTLEYLGRNDDQVQLRGYRIELGEIEAALCAHPAIAAAVAVASGEHGDARIDAYMVPAGDVVIDETEIRAHLAELIPGYMVPARLTVVSAIPMTANGKVDRSALKPAPSVPLAGVSVEGSMQETIADVWRSVLQRDRVGADENFFDIGGHSLLLVDVSTRLTQRLGRPVDIVTLFRYPTVRALAEFIGDAPTVRKAVEAQSSNAGEGIAIIGLAGRFPGAANVDELWENLCAGVESVKRLSAEELAQAGVPASLYEREDYVAAKAVLQDADAFDAAFFGMSPREAGVTDPQQRVFLECAWQALEDAGYDPARFPDRIGVVAGCGASGYLLNNIYPNMSALGSMGDFPLLIGNDKDYLATRVSYKMNLRGPSMTVGTACSSSLVAVDWACEALRLGKAEIMLAGGVSIKVPLIEGYTYEPEGILSADGHCRPFAADAGGTVVGCGAAVVVLKLLARAQADGDHIYAVIRGSATNNDGSGKVGYTAPSIDGQRTVISAALRQAGVHPRTLAYVEAHGTGTRLGDPIEVAALREAFEAGDKSAYNCALGSIKSNIGHLGAAAGAAGLIKTALAIEKARIPPTLHAETANPAISFGGFNLCTSLTDWPAENRPRRAGVSSFGIGGTNAHVVVEEAPAAPRRQREAGPLVFPLSAKTPEALRARCDQLRALVAGDRVPPLADIAYTLQNGRAEFDFRQAFVASTAPQLGELLSRSGACERIQRPVAVAFLIAGQGIQRDNLARSLYEREAVFRQTVDTCCEIARVRCDIDLQAALFPPDDGRNAMAETATAQPALFVFNYALTQLWASWGIQPQAILGHSLGEYVAACMAGVFALEDALQLVVERGRIMQRMEAGAMLAVPMSEGDLLRRLPASLDLAAVNGTRRCVAAGPVAAVEAFQRCLRDDGVEGQLLNTAHAFHSRAADAVADELALAVSRLPRRAPRIPYLSNVSGTWITADEAQDPRYYARHMRQTVRFSACLDELTARFQLLEIGPDETLSRLVPKGQDNASALASLRPRTDSDPRAMRMAAASLWQRGVAINWDAMGDTTDPRRVSLPGYPFSRDRHWLQTQAGIRQTAREPDSAPRPALDNWFYAPILRCEPGFAPVAMRYDGTWLLIGDDEALDRSLAAELAKACGPLYRACAGDRYQELAGNRFIVRAANNGDYEQLLAAIPRGPLHIVHTRTAAGSAEPREPASSDSYDDLVSLLQVISRYDKDTVRLTLISSGLIDVAGESTLSVGNATLTGALRVASQEIPGLSCRIIDVVPPRNGETPALAAILCADIRSESDTSLCAYRRAQRWVHGYERIPVPVRESSAAKGPVLITGGLGGIGLLAAEHFAGQAVPLVLVGRSPMPDRCSWDQWARQSTDDGSMLCQLLTAGLTPLTQWSEELQLREARHAAAMAVPQMDRLLEQRLDTLCSRHILEYLQQSGVDVSSGRRVTIAGLRTQLRIQSRYERFYQFFLRTLAADRWLSVEKDSVVFARPAATSPCKALERELLADYPDIAPQLKMLRQCVEGYGRALSGAVDGISVLYPEGRSDSVRESSADAEDADATRLYIRLLIDAIEQVVDRAGGRVVRILEVGAGNGFATRMLAPRLRDKNVEYVVTDLGRSFVLALGRWATEQHLDRVSTAPFDISRPAAEQGFANQDFDIVFGLNVVHAAPDIDASLRNLRALLVPGGVLGLVETVRSHRWTEMVWGLADGWWSFADTHLREHSPIMTVDTWDRACSGAGFSQIQSFPPSGPRRAAAESALILAQAPAAASEAFAAKHAGTAADIRHRIAAVRRIEDKGSPVMIACADASLAGRMEEIIAEAVRRFGPIRGVVHAAGDTREGRLSRPLGEVDSLSSQSLVRSKVAPAMVLDSLLEPESVEFAVAISSNAAILGGLGFTMYSAACNALDAFARGQPRLPWVSTNWDRWPTTRVLARNGATKTSIDRYAMDKEEAIGAFRRIVSSGLRGQIIVSAGDLQERLDRWVERADEQKPEPPGSAALLHRRPHLDVEFAPPASETEKGIARLWRELVGIEQIGIHDNFFDLGGDSLIGIQFVARAARQFSVQLPVQSLFEHPTIAALSGVVEQMRIARNALQVAADEPLAECEQEGEI